MTNYLINTEFIYQDRDLSGNNSNFPNRDVKERFESNSHPHPRAKSNPSFVTQNYSALLPFYNFEGYFDSQGFLHTNFSKRRWSIAL